MIAIAIAAVGIAAVLGAVYVARLWIAEIASREDRHARARDADAIAALRRDLDAHAKDTHTRIKEINMALLSTPSRVRSVR